RRIDAGLAGDVALDKYAAELLGDLLAGFRVEVQDRHFHALGGERPGRGGPEARRTAGDDGCDVFPELHVLSLAIPRETVRPTVVAADCEVKASCPPLGAAVNTPPPERRWLQITAQSRIGPPPADSGGHFALRASSLPIAFGVAVLGPDLVGDVAAAGL